MDDAHDPSEPLPLLARLYRERRSGVLSIGPAETALRILLRDGQIVGLGPLSLAPPVPEPRLPRPDDSARMRLDRVLAEIGIRSRPAPDAAPPSRNLRGRLLETLADRSLAATFEEGAGAATDVAETAGATEPPFSRRCARSATRGPCAPPSGTSTSASWPPRPWPRNARSR